MVNRSLSPYSVQFRKYLGLAIAIAVCSTRCIAAVNPTSPGQSQAHAAIRSNHTYSVVYWTNRYSDLFHNWKNCYRLVQLSSRIFQQDNKHLTDEEVLWVLSLIPPSKGAPIHPMYARISIVFDDLPVMQMSRFQKQITSTVLEHMLFKVTGRSYNGMGTSPKGLRNIIIYICNKLVELRDTHVIPRLTTICGSPAHTRDVDLLAKYLAAFKKMPHAAG